MTQQNQNSYRYLDILDAFHINQGDVVLVSSELLKIMWMCRNLSEKFQPDALLERLQDIVGKEGTILISTYNFDFSNKGFYDYNTSKSTVGFLGNTALARADFKRTRHPLHSFAVWGRDQELLCSMENVDSYAGDSPFSYLLEHQAKEIGLGIEYIQAFTFIHFVETQAKVPYRFHKTFEGTYVAPDGSQEIRRYTSNVRDRTMTYRTNKEGLMQFLEACGAAHHFEYHSVPCFLIDLAASYPHLYKNFTEGHCKGIFEFSQDRDYIFSDKYSICTD